MKLLRPPILLLIFISLLFTAIVAEVGLRVIFPETYFLNWHTDEYQRAKLLSKMKDKENSDKPVQKYQIENIIYDENLGWRMKPHFRYEGVVHNSKGFRGNKEYTKTPIKPLIFAVGDSYTYGLGVYDKDTFTSRLEDITGLEVINAGVNGFGLDQSYLMWELEGKKLNPSIVIVGYFVDDFYRNALSVSTKPKPHFIKDKNNQEFEIKWVPAPTVQSLIDKGELKPDQSLRIIQALKSIKRSFIEKYNLEKYFGYGDYRGLVERAELSDYLLIKFKESVEQSGARLLVVIIGIIDNCYMGQLEYSWIEESIVEVCEENDIDYLNLAELMRQNRYFTSFYARHCHFTESGHRFAAQKIAEKLDLVK